ncbi:ImmA/IrrE family metallo-endopeptidase [Streptacidiphilus sp. EB103A]|uniref:ImmA/IrrE family metallo-endopeptidase n=1 Tax=Streptacidiphilus sp. EB103A TaxID=3156275 RepID=UPI00351786DA
MTIEDLVLQAALLRDRPIQLHSIPPQDSDATSWGMAVSMPDTDLIVIREDSTPGERAWAIAHQLGHLLHEPADGAFLTADLLLAPPKAPAVAGRTAHRHRPARSRSEEQAEEFARLAARRVLV